MPHFHICLFTSTVTRKHPKIKTKQAAGLLVDLIPHIVNLNVQSPQAYTFTTPLDSLHAKVTSLFFKLLPDLT